MSELVLQLLTKLVNYIPEIVIIVVGAFGAFKSYMKVQKMTKEQKVEAALKVVKEEILSLMSNAEVEWKEYKKSGALKRSKVLTDIYKQFPFLSTYIDQDTLCQKIYDMIEAEMENMKNIMTDKKKLPEKSEIEKITEEAKSESKPEEAKPEAENK